MINLSTLLNNNNSIEFDTHSKKILLCVFLLVSDRIVCSLCYNILKKNQIPSDLCIKPLSTKIWTVFKQISKRNGQIMSIISFKIQSSIERLFPSFHSLYQNPLKKILVAPVYEEVLFRLILQEFLLRQIPRLILAEKENFLEVKSAKVFRIIFSSTIFALFHTDFWGKGPFVKAGINAQFIGGITLGIMTEQTPGILYSTLMHMFHNLSTGSTG